MTATGRRADQGETLVELLLAVMIMGVSAVSLMGTVMLTASASAQNEGTVLSSSMARTWAERLATAPYRPCASPSTTATAPAPTGWSGSAPTWTSRTGGVEYTASVLAVEHWNTAAVAFGSACSTDSGLQRYRLRVSTAGLGLQGTSEEIWVVNRNPCTAISQGGCS